MNTINFLIKLLGAFFISFVLYYALRLMYMVAGWFVVLMISGLILFSIPFKEKK